MLQLLRAHEISPSKIALFDFTEYIQPRTALLDQALHLLCKTKWTDHCAGAQFHQHFFVVV